MFTDSWRTALRENVATDMGILRLSIIGWSGFCSSDHYTTDLWQVHCPSTNNSDKCVEARLRLAFCEFFFLTSIFFFSTISVRQQRFWMKYLLLLHRLTRFWKYGPCTTTTTSYNGQVTTNHHAPIRCLQWISNGPWNIQDICQWLAWSRWVLWPKEWQEFLGLHACI